MRHLSRINGLMTGFEYSYDGLFNEEIKRNELAYTPHIVSLHLGHFFSFGKFTFTQQFAWAGISCEVDGTVGLSADIGGVGHTEEFVYFAVARYFKQYAQITGVAFFGLFILPFTLRTGTRHNELDKNHAFSD